MIKKQIPKFMVGFFTLVGFIIVLVAIVWIGASHYFEKGKTYITYFNQSVQGLQRDSVVKFRGVDVGRVLEILVAPDNRLIGVVMKINMREDLTKKVVAQLQLAGITGIVFVDLDLQTPQNIAQSPKLTFPTEYPVIPSQPGQLAQILDSVSAIATKFSELDMRGLVDQFKSTVGEIDTFLKSKRMQDIMAKADGTVGNLQSITGRVDKMVAEGKLANLLNAGTDSLNQVRLFAANLEKEIDSLNLREMAGKIDGLTREVKATSGSLQQSLENLDALISRLKHRPSDIIFGKAPEPRWNEREQVKP